MTAGSEWESVRLQTVMVRCRKAGRCLTLHLHGHGAGHCHPQGERSTGACSSCASVFFFSYHTASGRRAAEVKECE